jgi:erythronate-4-phosphate dehydrogenase
VPGIIIKMKIVADKNIPLLSETFGQHGEVLQLEGRQIRKADLANANVLLVRSVTRVNRSLLEGTPVRFVGSTTIGIDHLDTNWLEANSISWAHAPGCNADSAAQYALAMMWLACDRLQINFRQQSVGIIGRGNVGGRLENLLNVLGIPVMACDPPLREAGAHRLVSMQEACTNSIISLHVPLTRSGSHSTENLMSEKLLRNLTTGTLLVNTARGPVIEGPALLQQLQSGRLHAALDVWPDEPYIARQWLESVCVATPHVAGYSLEGKLKGTEMVYQAFCNKFFPGSAQCSAPLGEGIKLPIEPRATVDQALQQAIESSCPVSRDDAALRAAACLPDENRCVQIDGLRSAYPVRREFKSYEIQDGPSAATDQLGQLGFKIAWDKAIQELFSAQGVENP